MISKGYSRLAIKIFRPFLIVTVLIFVFLLVFSVLRTPAGEREAVLLAAISGALAAAAGIGITVFLIVAQIYSPYYSGLRTLLTGTTLIYLCALIIGILLPLAVLQGSTLRWLTGEPIRFLRIFEINWTNLCFAWFAACLILLPLFLRYAQKLVGPRGVIGRAEESLLKSESRSDYSSVNDRLQTLYHVAMTAVERREIAVMHLAFDALVRTLWRTDAKCRNAEQLKGRALVITHEVSILSPPDYQEDPWRLTYRELRLLQLAICGTGCSHLLLEECGCISKLCIRAMREDLDTSTIGLAVVSLFAEALERGVVANQPEVVMVVATEIERIAKEAVKLGIPKTPRQNDKRRYLFESAMLAVKSFKSAFLSESGDLRLEVDKRSSTWARALWRTKGSIQNIATACLDESIIGSVPFSQGIEERCKTLKQRLDLEDELTRSQLAKIAHEAIKNLNALRLQLEKVKWHGPAKQFLSTIRHLGLTAANIGWAHASGAAIASLQYSALEFLNVDTKRFRTSLDSIRNIGLAATFQSRDSKIILKVLRSLTSIARAAIMSSKEDLAFEAVGEKNGVVTILGYCHHKLGVPPFIDAKKRSMVIQQDLNWIKVHSGSHSNLQNKAEQALHELNCWIP